MASRVTVRSTSATTTVVVLFFLWMGIAGFFKMGIPWAKETITGLFEPGEGVPVYNPREIDPGIVDLNERMMAIIPYVLYKQGLDEYEGIKIDGSGLKVSQNRTFSNIVEEDWWELIAERDRPIFAMSRASFSPQGPGRRGSRVAESLLELWGTARDLGNVEVLEPAEGPEWRTYAVGHIELYWSVAVGNVTSRRSAERIQTWAANQINVYARVRLEGAFGAEDSQGTIESIRLEGRRNHQSNGYLRWLTVEGIAEANQRRYFNEEFVEALAEPVMTERNCERYIGPTHCEGLRAKARDFGNPYKSGRYLDRAL